MRNLAAIALLIVVVLLVVWFAQQRVPPAPAPASNPTASAESEGCDPQISRHVYRPQRLRVFSPCITVTGTIVDATHGRRRDGVRKEQDGDTHGWLRLDPPFARLVNEGNIDEQGGNLVFEIVCYWKPRQADALDSCPETYLNTVALPPVGSHVEMTGEYVQDDNHAHWMEIHAVSWIRVME